MRGGRSPADDRSNSRAVPSFIFLSSFPFLQRRKRKATRAARAAAIAAGKKPPGLSTRIASDTSIATSTGSLIKSSDREKNAGAGGGGGGTPVLGYGGRGAGGGGQQMSLGQGYDQYAQGQGQYGQNNGGYQQQQPTSPNESIPSPSSASSKSGSSSSKGKSGRGGGGSRHQPSPSNGSNASDPPNSADPLRRYQPAKPSPLAAGAVAARAAPKAEVGENGPKWGQGPFRSKSEDEHLAMQQRGGEQIHSNNNDINDPNYDKRKTMMSDSSDYGAGQSGASFDQYGGTAQVSKYGYGGLAPPLEEEVLTTDGRAKSGEWGVAYSGQQQGGGGGGQNAYASGGQYQQQQNFITEPTTTQPQRSNYNYGASSPPRNRNGNGGGDDEYGYHQYSQDLPPAGSVQDPYAGYSNGGGVREGGGGGRQEMDPYAYAGGAGRGYDNRI